MSPFTTAGTAFTAIPAVAPDLAHPYWTFERVAAALGTGPSMPNPLAGVSTDTRRVARGEVFVALVGEQYDAHDFLAQARDAGAAAFVVSDPKRLPGLAYPRMWCPIRGLRWGNWPPRGAKRGDVRLSPWLDRMARRAPRIC